MKTYPLTFQAKAGATPEVATATCADSATFALRVLDQSMEPEFVQGCIIVIDPSAAVKEGAYVFARIDAIGESGDPHNDDAEYVLRQAANVGSTQVTINALQPDCEHSDIVIKREQIEGVIVQRAGIRRSYSKHYS